MDDAPAPLPPSAPRIESLRVRNFRALRDLELRDLTPLTAFVGPNGSGKSTIFDVFAFLHEAFTGSLRAAVESRFGMRELRSRGEEGPVEIELWVRLELGSMLLHYHTKFDEEEGQIVVLQERLVGQEFEGEETDELLLDLALGKGQYYNENDDLVTVSLPSAAELALPSYGRIGLLGWLPDVEAFVSDWYVSDLDASDVRSIPGAGPQRRVSATGDNVANVLEWLAERRPERLERIEAELRKRVPRLGRIAPVATGDGRSMLVLEDAPFSRGIPAKFASEGTLSLLAYLTVLYGPDRPALMAFEEPEENLPPQLLYGLTEAFRGAAEGSQVFLNTHSPFVLDALRPEEVRVLYRDEAGFTRAVRAADIPGVPEMVDAGAALGALWQEGFFGVGDPLRNGGAPGASGAA